MTFPQPLPIGDTATQYGFDFNGLIRVERCCSSRRPERSRWAVVRVRAANGDYVDVTVSPRKCHVEIKRKEKK